MTTPSARKGAVAILVDDAGGIMASAVDFHTPHGERQFRLERELADKLIKDCVWGPLAGEVENYQATDMLRRLVRKGKLKLHILDIELP